MIVVDEINISDDKIDQRNWVLVLRKSPQRQIRNTCQRNIAHVVLVRQVVAHTTRLDLNYLTDKYNICDITLTSIPDLLLKKPKDKFWLDS